MIGRHFAPTAALWRRDLVRTMRKRRSAVFLALYAGILAIVVISMWPPQRVNPYFAQSMAEQVLAYFTFISFGWMALIMPAYGGAAITQERERDTFEMLSLTLVPAWGVVLGKWGANAALFLFVLLAATPVMAAMAFFTVGAEIRTFAALIGLIAGTAIATVAIGVLCSTLVKSSKAGVIFSYVGVAMLFGLPIIVIGAIIELLVPGGNLMGVSAEELFEFLGRYLTPIGAAGFLFEGSLEWYQYVGVQGYLGGVSLIAFAIACYRVHKMNVPGVLTRRKQKREAPEQPKRRIPRFRPMGDRRNAWYARESKYGSLTRRWVKFAVFAGGFAVFALIASMFAAMYLQGGGGQQHDVFAAWMGVCMVALFVVLPGIAANAFTGEFDDDRIDLLRSTLLTTRQFVLGSVGYTIVSVLPLVLGMCCATLLLLALIGYDDDTFGVIWTGAGSNLAALMLASTAGVAAGTFTRRTATALMFAYLTVFTISLGAYGAIYLVREFMVMAFTQFDPRARDTLPTFNDAKNVTMMSSPFLSYIDNFSEARRGNVVTEYWWRSVFLAFAYSIVFVLAAIAGFQRRISRDT